LYSEQEVIADRIKAFLTVERPGMGDVDTSSSEGEEEEDFEHVNPEDLEDDQ
jgi:hypothetical protein